MSEMESALLDIVSNHAVGLTTTPTRETLITDLGIDSFSVVEIIYEVEERLNVEVPFNANENPFGDMKTVGDMVDALEALAQAK